jgi:hypothetical protein
MIAFDELLPHAIPRSPMIVLEAEKGLLSESNERPGGIAWVAPTIQSKT